jgi:hypothetical protein
VKPWENLSEATVGCSCGEEFRSKAQFDMEKPTMVSEKPCPACGRTEGHRRISMDPEQYGLRG